jgi:signal transduction histidine kinase
VETTACTILLVDDEVANLDLLETVLRPRGYERLVRVSDAREAVATFVATRPDLVLLDLHMPHRTGFDVLADLGAHVPDGEFVPVLVLTADVTAPARDRALASGAHDFVTKPFDRSEVLLRVRNLLRTRLLHLDERRAREAAERVAARDRLLADASRLLDASLDGATALEQLAGRLVPELADACTVEHDGPGGDAALGGDAARTLRLPLGGGTARGAVADVALRLVRSPPHPAFDDADVALAGEIARRAGRALERARLVGALQDAVAARDQVLAVVAHDLRSPLTAVRFDVEMLQLDSTRALGASDAATLARVERAVARMDRLIEDLLDVARIGRDALALDRRMHDVRALLDEAVATLRPLVVGHGLTFEAHGDDALPALPIDGPRLLQALSNLVGNAVKFAAHDGRVSLTWRLAEHDGAREVRIAVCDDGAGIGPEALQHIFGAFWQARHADRRGLGLGLAIARAIVDAHGGRIWVESVVGQGSTFVVALPVGGAA